MDILTINPVVLALHQYLSTNTTNNRNPNIVGYSTHSISGNAMTPSGICDRVLFVNSNYNMEATVIPNNNGDFIYYCNDDTYTVIMVGPNNIETKVLYNVHPLNSNINIH